MRMMPHGPSSHGQSSSNTILPASPEEQRWAAQRHGLLLVPWK